MQDKRTTQRSRTSDPVLRGLVTLRRDLYLRAERLCRNRALAEDLVQDTAVRALTFRHQYTEGTSLRGWLFQILFSVFVTRYRRARRDKRALSVLGTDPASWTHEVRFATPDRSIGPSRALSRAVLSVPTPFRDALVCVDVDDRSYRDTALALGIPVGTVMSRLHRARKILRDEVLRWPTQPEAVWR